MTKARHPVKIFEGKQGKKVIALLNKLAAEHFKQRCTHPRKYLRELPNQENVRLENREAKCLKCGAILIGYLGRDNK